MLEFFSNLHSKVAETIILRTDQQLHRLGQSEKTMNKRFSVFTLLIMFAVPAFADYSMEDVLRLRNDKEVSISSFSQRERDRIVIKYSDKDQRENITKVFYKSLVDFLNEDDNQCDLRFIEILKKRLAENKIVTDKNILEDHLKMLRVFNGIDDIFYELLSADNKDFENLKKLNLSKKPKASIFAHKKLLENNNVKELFSNFEEYPNETETCSFQEFIFIKNKIKGANGKKSENEIKDLKILAKKALQEKVITLETYNKLEYLRDEGKVQERLIFMKDYLKIIFQAKNQMTPIKQTYKPIKLEDEDKFSTERMKRFSRLTRRKLLYKKYDETEIILLAQILQKASRRMGVDPDTQSGIPYINQEFNVLQPNGERRTYVERFDLDPQSQFNLARRLLRKDILEAQMMAIFNGLKITYEDLVMAAFETGYISIEDIQYVVRYDDLWNPEITKFERVSGFVFQVAGYTTFFLPPPWNIIGTIALGITEGIVDKKTNTGVDHDNPSTFIE